MMYPILYMITLIFSYDFYTLYDQSDILYAEPYILCYDRYAFYDESYILYEYEDPYII